MSRYLLGSIVDLSTTTKVDDVLTNATAVTLTVTKPDGTDDTPTVVHDGTGAYSYQYTPATVGHYIYTFEATGTAAGIDTEEFDVYTSTRNIIDVDDLKRWLKITDTNDDPTLTIAANAANRAVVLYCRRSFEYVPVGGETARVFRPDARDLVYVDDFHDASGLVIETDDSDTGSFTATWVVSDFEVEPLNGLDAGMPTPYYRLRAVGIRRFPQWRRHSTLRVTAAWGWLSVPDDVFAAALIKAARIWKRKNSPEGVLGFADMAVRVSNREDPDVCALLNPYVRVDRGPVG